MSINTKTAASFVCARGGWKVTNLSLQKILYVAQMLHLGRTGARLIDDAFEAWDYGPVVPSLYHRVKAFGDKPIQDIFFSRPLDQNSAEGKTLTETCNVLLPKKPGDLVALTHWSRGAWAKHYRPGVRGIAIPDADIINEYRDRTTAAR